MEYNSSDTLVKGLIETPIGAFILAENTILIAVISSMSKLQTSKYVFAVSLAVTDVLVGSGTLFTGLVCLLPLKSLWRSRKVVDAMVSLVTAGMVMLSILHMAVVAMERYLYIAHPFFHNRRLTLKTIRWTVAVIWLVGLAYDSCLAFIFWRRLDASYEFPLESVSFVFAEFFMLIPYVFMTTVTCVFYALILWQVRKHRRSMMNLGASNHVSRWTELAKSLKFFLSVFGIYVLMTSPLFILHMSTRDYSLYNGLGSVFVYLLNLNSGANFWVLLLVDELFRQSMKTKVCRFKTWLTDRCICAGWMKKAEESP